MGGFYMVAERETSDHPTKQKDNDRFSQHKPKVALVLSLIFAGLGQFYNRRYIKGALFFLIELAFILELGYDIQLGFWGVWTLGTVPGLDDSIQLLVYGIFMIIITLFGIGIYVLNIRDAYKQAITRKTLGKLPNLKDSFKAFYDKGFPYFITIPGFILLIFVVVFPLVFSLTLAFTNYNLYHSPPRNLVSWVGLKNFAQLFTVAEWKDSFFGVLTWTIVWTVVATTLQIALGLFLAVIVNDKRVKFKRAIRTILILPWAVPAFVSILIFKAMFNDGFGAINNEILIPLFGGKGLPWLSDPFYTKLALIMIQTWLGFPFLFALFSGVLQSVSSEWYEAADVDGGSKWQKFRFITLPHVLYATAPLIITQYAGNFNNFNIIYLFNNGGPAVEAQNAGGTDILISWVYKLTFDTNQYGMAAAVTIIMGLFVTIISFLQFRRTRAFKEEGQI
jgi:arabinogalactan oligomer / maltooligosaccharide transport system permease protein